MVGGAGGQSGGKLGLGKEPGGGGHTCAQGTDARTAAGAGAGRPVVPHVLPPPHPRRCEHQRQRKRDNAVTLNMVAIIRAHDLRHFHDGRTPLTPGPSAGPKLQFQPTSCPSAPLGAPQARYPALGVEPELQGHTSAQHPPALRPPAPAGASSLPRCPPRHLHWGPCPGLQALSGPAEPPGGMPPFLGAPISCRATQPPSLLRPQDPLSLRKGGRTE